MHYTPKSKFISYHLRQSDTALWLLALAAVVYGLLLIADVQRAGSYNYLKTQIAATAVGFAAAAVISAADYRYMLQRRYVFALVGLLLAISVFVFGSTVSGTDDTAWIVLPGGFTVQPSEFMKVCFIVTFSCHLSVLKEKGLMQKARGVLSLAAHAAVPMALIHLQGDDGAVLIFALMAVIMSFAAGVRLRYFAALGGLLLLAAPIIWNFFMNDEHRSRILALLDLDGSALTGYGWQQYQGKVSVASGELWGSGLFCGKRVAQSIVPEQENDFIFTVAGEELGFAGCAAVLLLLFLIIMRVMHTAKASNDPEGQYVCIGVFAMLASQTMINVGMVLGFLPVVGITLPLFSAGGSSAAAALISLGLVQSVHVHSVFK